MQRETAVIMQSVNLNVPGVSVPCNANFRYVTDVVLPDQDFGMVCE